MNWEVVSAVGDIPGAMVVNVGYGLDVGVATFYSYSSLVQHRSNTSPASVSPSGNTSANFQLTAMDNNRLIASKGRATRTNLIRI